MSDPRGGRKKMSTYIKPIRPTVPKFANETDRLNFLNYATSTKKSDSPGLNRLRELRNKHKRAEELK